MTARRARMMPTLAAPETLQRVYILGICGTAMGTLAAMLRSEGRTVLGSDPAPYPPMSTWLASRGVEPLAGWDAANVPADVDVVVVGNVVRRDNPEVQRAEALGLPCISLPEALRWFYLRPPHRTFMVTGTHGKTTTTTMAAAAMHALGDDPSLFVGGVSLDFDGSFRLGRGVPFVVEGDEYDSAFFDKVPKFWHYPAFAATVNNVEFDHADIYPDLQAVRRVFVRMADQVDPRGQIWVNGDDPVACSAVEASWATVLHFGLTQGLDLWAEPVATGPEGTRVRLAGRMLGTPVEVVWPLIGHHNVRNALGAMGLCLAAGHRAEDAAEALRGWKGVRKRQEVRGEADGVLVVDDFAHHPTAVRETLAALRLRWPGRRLWVAFETKSNTSRRRVFQEEFAEAFRGADAVVFSQPWRKDDLPPEALLDLPKLAGDLTSAGVPATIVPQVPDLVTWLLQRVEPGDLVAGLSGSSFDGLHDRLLAGLRARVGA
jgi:UDP-N-acetylmuramate: L-alanyl-gamma-D-glutamyl-meso-diaminopimelate ligase